MASAALLAAVGGFATYTLTRPSAARQFRKIYAELVGFETAMCKCTEKTCADAVMDGMNKWAMAIAKETPQHSSQPTEEQMKRMTTVAEHFGQCMTKAMRPPEPPPQ